MNISVPAVAEQGARLSVADLRPILFLHIPKCAGTSVVSMFNNMVGEAHARRLHLTTLEATEAEIAAGLDPGAGDIAFLSGHVPYSFFAPHEGAFRLLTMLRDPVARVVSLFRFLRVHPDLDQRGLPDNFTFEEFMASPSGAVFPAIDNAMCRMLSREARFHDDAAPEFWTLESHAHVLDEALATLRGSVFGLAERMAESCRLVRHHFEIPFALTAPALNATRPDENCAALRQVAQIRARNQLDLALYARAQAMFAERVAALPGGPCVIATDATRTVFRPTLERHTVCPMVAGRQGFHDIFDGLSWIIAHETARLHFIAPTPVCRIVMKLYLVSPDYPVERIALRVNGTNVGFTVENLPDDFLELQTDVLTLRDGLNILTIEPPEVLPVRDIIPDGDDDRHLSVAVASFMVTRRACPWPQPPPAPKPAGALRSFLRANGRRVRYVARKAKALRRVEPG